MAQIIELVFCDPTAVPQSIRIYNSDADPVYQILFSYYNQGPIWLPNTFGGVCVNVRAWDTATTGTSLTLANLVGLTSLYLTCESCLSDHPKTEYLILQNCNGTHLTVDQGLTNPTIYALLGWFADVGAVHFFPAIGESGICAIVVRFLSYDPPVYESIEVVTQDTIQYNDCSECNLAHPPIINIENIIIESVCSCLPVNYIYYFWCHVRIPPYSEGFYNIPLLDNFLGINPTCWKIRQATHEEVQGLPQIPIEFSCIETSLNAIQYPDQATCMQNCSDDLIGTVTLTSCCNGQVIIVKTTISVVGTYSIQQLAILYPWAGNCWRASSHEGPDYELDITGFEVITQELCGECSVGPQPSYQVPCNCPKPICYELIPCPGSFVPSLIASNDLSAYVNSVVMVNGQCYTVQPGTENCTESQVVEIFDTFAQCGDQSGLPNTKGCVYCDCPDDYYPNEDKTECIKNTCVTPTNNGQPYRVVGTDGGVSNTWGHEGTRIYEDISGFILPIAQENPDNPGIWPFRDNDGAGAILSWIPAQPVQGSPWPTPPSNVFTARLSTVGIWPVENPINEWVGITVCITITEKKSYTLGLGADSQFILKHNGVEIIKDINTGLSAYRVWNIFEIKLPVGQHVFEYFVNNISGVGGMGFEVYNADQNTIANATSVTLPGLILFSTQTLAEQATPAYFYLGDNAYSCPPGYFLNDCDGTGTNLQCCLVPKSLPYVHCEPSYLIESCVVDDQTPPITTNTDLSLLVGKTTKICIDGKVPSNPYPACDLCDPDYTWSAVSESSAWKGDCKSPEGADGRRHCYSPCTIFFVNPKGFIYYVNPFSSYHEQILSLPGILNSGSNIANTADRLWVLCGVGINNYIQEFSITLSPFQYVTGVPNPPTLTWIRNIPASVPTFMDPACAKDNNILYGGLVAVIEYNISGPTVTFTTLFTLPNSGSIKDLMFLPATNSILVLGTDTIGDFLSEFSLGGINPDPVGTELNRAALSYSDFGGIMVNDLGEITVIRIPYNSGTHLGNDVYPINQTNTGWEQGPTSIQSLNVNLLGGVSKNPACTNLTSPGIWPSGCYCIKVTELPYTDEAIEWPYTTGTDFENCETCLKPCYALTTCYEEGIEPTVIIVNNDLSQYLGRVVKFPRLGDKCWIVSSAECASSVTVPGEVNGFTDCETCNPIPPPIVCMIGRPVKPGYDTPGCPPEYYERISCTFGKQAFDEMVQSRYGIKICCDHEMDKWDVRWEILKLKAIFDPSLCVTLTPSPSLTLSVSYHCEGETFILTVTLVVVGGSGSYQTQQYVNGAWENLGDIYYGTKNGTIEVITTISVPEPKAFKYRVLDVICCTLGSNTIEGTFEPCECVPTITSSGSFACTQPLDGSGTLTWNNTYHCGSGNYIVQIFDKNAWNDVITYSSITEGSDTQTYFVSNQRDNGNLLLRVIDADSGTIGNEFTVVVDDCSPGEIIVLSNTSFKCMIGIDGEIDGNITVTNGSGTYHLQIFNLGTWVLLDVISGVSTGNININTPVLGGADAPGDYLIRIQDAITLVVSNTSQITIIACDPSAETLKINFISALGCVFGQLNASFTYTITNPQGTVDLEYYNGISWQVAVPMVSNGGPWSTTLPSGLMGQLDTSFRLHDNTSGMYSAEYPVFGLIPTCGPTTLTLNSVSEGYIFSLQNAFKAPTRPDFEIIFQFATSEFGSMADFEYYNMGSQPVTNGYFIGGSPTPGFWYRIVIGDGYGGTIVSNTVQAI